MGYEEYLTDEGAISDLNSKKNFLDRLLIAYKKKNIEETVNIFQYFHMMERVSNWVVTVPVGVPVFGGRTYTLNLMNGYATGDIEGMYYALIWGVPDDMSEPDHWMSVERRDWLADQIKSEMGWP